eukprot:COSAG02_NODE_8856_length_2418_cov_8.282881_2_plen_95_part_00
MFIANARIATYAEAAAARVPLTCALIRFASFLFEAADSRQSVDPVAGWTFALKFFPAFLLAVDSRPSAAPVAGRRRLAAASASPTPLRAARMYL